MKIVEIVFLLDIIDKCIAKHDVWPDEIEEVFEGNPDVKFVERGFRHGEDVYVACGRTSGGRSLMVFFIYKRGGKALVISARPMTRKERRYHEK